jgi:hypothetical protein
LLRSIWNGGAAWATWERFVWRLSLIGGSLWTIYGLLVAFAATPPGYIDPDAISCYRTQEVTDTFGVPAVSTVLGCPGENLYRCTGIGRSLCESQLPEYLAMAQREVDKNADRLADHVVAVTLNTFGKLLAYFLALGGIFAIVDRFKQNA